ncbi:hypothetical protein CA11_43450 [Gimesia maris]|nr:hypothetical protein CA11_43450 [Gimesia maris]
MSISLFRELAFETEYMYEVCPTEGQADSLLCTDQIDRSVTGNTDVVCSNSFLLAALGPDYIRAYPVFLSC